MKFTKTIFLLMCAVCSAGCSFFTSVEIVNDSDAPIEVLYKLDEKSSFDAPRVKSLADRNIEKSIRRFWTEDKGWEELPKNEYQTNVETRERTIKIAPRQVALIDIEPAGENPFSISELKIITPNGEIFYKGKLLPEQFEKNGYTFTKTYENKNTK